jgi:hypothetical protein
MAANSLYPGDQRMTTAGSLSLPRRGFAFVAMVISVPVLLLGCPKKEAPMSQEDAAAPAPLAPSAPAVTELAPVVEDAGEDADAAEASPPKKWTGPALSANQAKIKVCCNAMRSQAKQLGASPEGYQLNTMAMQCDAFVVQIGPQGTAPELSQFREVLKNIKLPAACQF